MGFAATDCQKLQTRVQLFRPQLVINTQQTKPTNQNGSPHLFTVNAGEGNKGSLTTCPPTVII